MQLLLLHTLEMVGTSPCRAAVRSSRGQSVRRCRVYLPGRLLLIHALVVLCCFTGVVSVGVVVVFSPPLCFHWVCLWLSSDVAVVCL